MTSRQFSRKRIGRALGLLALSLALLIGSAGYGQSEKRVVKAKTDANGKLVVQLWPPPPESQLQSAAAAQAWFIIDSVVDRPKKAERPDDKLLRFAEMLVGHELPPIPKIIEPKKNENWRIETCYSTRGLPAISISYVFWCAAQGRRQPSPGLVNNLQQQEQDRMLFAGLKEVKVEISGEVMVIKSPLTDHPAVRQNVLYMTDLVVHDLKLKVGETFTLAPDALPKLKEVSNPLRNPEIRLNTKPEIAEARVIQKEGEVFGSIEFKAKAAGETMILIDYDLFSQIAQVVLSQARLQVNVVVE